MNNLIIKSESFVFRYKKLSFLLSLICTGLGQIYNGEATKGIAFLFIHLFLLLILPFLIIINQTSNYLYVFIIITILNLIIIIYSIFDALFKIKKNNKIVPKWYNSFIFYLVFFLFNRFLVVTCITILFSFYGIKKITSEMMYPTISKNSYVLTTSIQNKNLEISDIILINKNQQNKIYRIIAKDNKKITYQNKKIFVNGDLLEWGIIDEKQLKVIGLENDENIFTEKNKSKFYTIANKQVQNKDFNSIIIKSSEYFLIADNRKIAKPIVMNLPENVNRVEGILYSSNFKRIFAKLVFEDKE